MVDTFAAYDRAAHRAVKLPKGWSGFIFTAVGNPKTSQGVIVTGAVCPEVYKRGPRKGEPNWRRRDRSTERQVFVSHKAYKAARAAIAKAEGRAP